LSTPDVRSATSVARGNECARSGAATRAIMAGIVLALALSTALVAGGASWGSTYRPDRVDRQSVIVRVVPGRDRAARAAVVRLGGTPGRPLGIIDGFIAEVPGARVGALSGLPFVRSVSANAPIHSLAADYSGVDPENDMGSMVSITKITGAQTYWKAGYTGKGIDVAVIDTGVAQVDGLTAPGKVVNGPDLSFDSQQESARYVDRHGHGTHMAGIIAGRANAADPSAYVGNTKNFLGMAPDARIVNVKVGDSEGATDVSQVIAAIDWVVQHRNDPGLNIRVLSISYGTDSGQPYELDPLAFAAEQAVRAGIVVVAAAGNAGFSKEGTLTNPAYDPFVLAVGASDPNGTLVPWDDDVAPFSSVGSSSSGGNKGRSPDLLAPGAHVISLRAPGSLVDQSHPEGYVNSALFRGSGTSQAAAVVAGAAALVLQQRPTLTPDELKKLLMNAATSLKGTARSSQGYGQLNLGNALNRATPSWSEPSPPSTGTGSLELARGSLHVENYGVVLKGEKDIFGMPFVSAQMALLEAAGSSWSGGIWNGSSWSGSSWSGSSWSASSWSGSSWSGSSWSGSSWSGSSWSSSSWSASSWSSSSWSSSSWSSAGWLGASWD
jgi:subtilisin family serine protease